MDYTKEDWMKQVTYKNLLICNTILSIAQSLNKLFDKDAWSLIFEGLQKISCLVYKNEYSHFSITPNLFHFKLIGDRVLENLRRFEAEKKLSPKINLGTRVGLMADTGGVRDDSLIKNDSSSPERKLPQTDKLKVLNRSKTEQRISFISKPSSATAMPCSLYDIQQEGILFFNSDS